jgi:RNA polymerase sigma-70 factor (ECF subfamily)
MKGEQYLSDEEIFRRIIDGDSKALAAAINLYQPQMMIEASYLLRDIQECEDIIQELFIYVWEHRQNLRSSKYSTLGPYLLRATRNKCLDRLSKNKTAHKRKDFLSHRMSSVTSYDPVEIKELKKIIESAIASLPPKYQQSFRMLYEEEISQKEIARQENVALQTVKNKIANCLKVLRKKLGPLR